MVSMESLPTIDSLDIGPGDSGRRTLSVINCDRLSLVVCSVVPHISHAGMPGKFSNVHFGQVVTLPFLGSPGLPLLRSAGLKLASTP